MSLSINEKIKLSEINGGIKGWYGLKLRPASLGAVPKSFSAIFGVDEAKELFGNLSCHTSVRHGVVAYPEPLEQCQVDNYDLVCLDRAMATETFNLDSIPKSELEKSLANLLAEHFLKVGDNYTIAEIEADSEFELKEAFKGLTIFANRKDNLKLFNEYVVCLKTLHYKSVINRLIELRKIHSTN